VATTAVLRLSVCSVILVVVVAVAATPVVTTDGRGRGITTAERRLPWSRDADA
jgi:hypothetical protein